EFRRVLFRSIGGLGQLDERDLLVGMLGVPGLEELGELAGGVLAPGQGDRATLLEVRGGGLAAATAARVGSAPAGGQRNGRRRHAAGREYSAPGRERAGSAVDHVKTPLFRRELRCARPPQCTSTPEVSRSRYGIDPAPSTFHITCGSTIGGTGVGTTDRLDP